MTVALDHPCLPQPGNELLWFRSVAIDMAKALLALDDFLRTVKSALRQECCENTIRCRFSSMKRLATGTPI